MFFYIIMSTHFSFALPRLSSQRISFSSPFSATLLLCISLLDVANLHHSNASQLETLPCLAMPFHRVTTQCSTNPPLCLTARYTSAAVLCEAAQRKTSPCLFIVLLNSAPLFHGYSLLNQSVTSHDCATHFHCFSTVFSTILCRRYDYQVDTLPLQCHAVPLNFIPFQRKTALRVSVANQRISLLFHCRAVRG